MAALFQVAAALLRATGSSVSPLKAMLVSTLVNIVLDYVLSAMRSWALQGLVWQQGWRRELRSGFACGNVLPPPVLRCLPE